MSDEREPAPYRDERASLNAEIVRLRTMLARAQRRSSLAPVVVGLVLHLVIRQVLGPLFNGSSDSMFWLALVLSALPLVYAAIQLGRALLPPKEEGP
jgi:hypothetical protein